MELYKALKEASSPTTPLVWLPELILRRGKEPEAICRSVGLDDAFRRDPLKPLPLSNYSEVLNGLARHLELPDLGALIAERIRVVDLVRIAPLLNASETLEEALCKICEVGTQRLLPGCRVVLLKRGDRCLLHVEMPPGSVELRRPFTEMLILLFPTIIRRALGPAWSPRRLLFRHRSPASLATLQRRSEATIHFGQRYDGLEFPAALLNEAMPSRSFDLGSLHHVMHRELLNGRGGIDQTARMFGLSRRSLQRRLSAEHTSYKALLLELRMNLAIDYLGSPQGSIGSISRHLGYNHHADFTRSFKRRFGITPLDYRRKKAG